MTTYLSKRRASAIDTDALTVPTGASAGNVLTSDATGNATWQPAPGGPSSDTSGFSFNPTGGQFTLTSAVFTRAGNTLIMHVIGTNDINIPANGSISAGQVIAGAGSLFLPNGYNPLHIGMSDAGSGYLPFISQYLQPNGFVNLQMPSNWTTINAGTTIEFTIALQIQ